MKIPPPGNVEVTNAFISDCKSRRAIEFNPAWVNTKDRYLDKAISGNIAPELEIGVGYHCVDKDGRNIMLIGTELGNVAVFQLSTKNKHVIVAQATPIANHYIGDRLGQVGAIDTMELLDFIVNVQAKFAGENEEYRLHILATARPTTGDTGTKEPTTPLEAVEDLVKEAQANGENVEMPEAPKAAEQTQSQDQSKPKEQDMKQANKTEAKPQLTNWGVFWRVSGLAVLCVAIVTAIILGVYYGGAYLIGLGLSEITLAALNYLISAVSGVGIGYTIIKTVEWIRDLFDRKEPATAAAPEAATAAA